jgi:hypothetical protein
MYIIFYIRAGGNSVSLLSPIRDFYDLSPYSKSNCWVSTIFSCVSRKAADSSPNVASVSNQGAHGAYKEPFISLHIVCSLQQPETYALVTLRGPRPNKSNVLSRGRGAGMGAGVEVGARSFNKTFRYKM